MLKKALFLILLQLLTNNIIFANQKPESDSKEEKKDSTLVGFIVLKEKDSQLFLDSKLCMEGDMILMGPEGETRNVNFLESFEHMLGKEFSDLFKITEETNIDENLEEIINFLNNGTQFLLDLLLTAASKSSNINSSIIDRLINYSRILNFFKQIVEAKKNQDSAKTTKELAFYKKLYERINSNDLLKFQIKIADKEKENEEEEDLGLARLFVE